jgi:hypothetical protein
MAHRELACPCGITLTGADDEELFLRGRQHADEHHPDDNITDEFIRDHVATNARNAAAFRWSVCGGFLEGLANRDYAKVAASLDPDVRFRALLPPGPQESEGADAVAGTFRSWFGDVDEFELVDANVGEVGGRLHLSWRIRVRPAPFGIGEGWHVIEQQAYADAGQSIRTIDVLCSGFNPERVAI